MPRWFPDPPGRLNLRRLQWLAVAVPLVFVAAREYVIAQLGFELLSWRGRLLMTGIVAVAVIFFYGAVFAVVRAMQQRLERQNRELLALHHASLDIYGELSLDVILQKVVDQARAVVEARYGAMSVIRADGSIVEFVTSGLTQAERERIGHPPVGKGLLGVVLHEGRHLRLADIASDPRSAGFPRNHPQMTSLLAVRVVGKGPFRGNLYVANKETAAEFSQDDEDTLVRFARQAAIAIDNAHLHEQLRSLAVAEERARIAREMHDGMAQVLASVNTKAQAVREFLRRGKTEQAEAQLAQLASAAREVHGEVREGILALRSAGLSRPLAEDLREFLAGWQAQHGVAVDLEIGDEVELAPAVEVQLMRILQEALANARKHARVDHVRLSVERDGQQVVARVVDEGAGFDGAARPGRQSFGLAVMHERAQSVGGEVRVDSAPGRGTRVEVRVPARGGMT